MVNVMLNITKINWTLREKKVVLGLYMKPCVLCREHVFRLYNVKKYNGAKLLTFCCTKVERRKFESK